MSNAEHTARAAGCIETRNANNELGVLCPDGEFWEHELFHDDSETWEAACAHLKLAFTLD